MVAMITARDDEGRAEVSTGERALELGGARASMGTERMRTEAGDSADRAGTVCLGGVGGRARARGGACAVP